MRHSYHAMPYDTTLYHIILDRYAPCRVEYQGVHLLGSGNRFDCGPIYACVKAYIILCAAYMRGGFAGVGERSNMIVCLPSL
jgi:hypothetical protein